MIIIETCPVCGHDLQDLILTTYPPIPKKLCPSCGWSWTGEREEVIRVPFGGNSFVPDTTNYLNVNGSDTITITRLNNLNHEDTHIGNFEQFVCINCPSNPKNGGDGICFCTLGQQVTY